MYHHCQCSTQLGRGMLCTPAHLKVWVGLPDTSRKASQQSGFQEMIIFKAGMSTVQNLD